MREQEQTSAPARGVRERDRYAFLSLFVLRPSVDGMKLTQLRHLSPLIQMLIFSRNILEDQPRRTFNLRSRGPVRWLHKMALCRGPSELGCVRHSFLPRECAHLLPPSPPLAWRRRCPVLPGSEPSMQADGAGTRVFTFCWENLG